MNSTKSSLGLPDTGISGVYEMCYATDNVEFALQYFASFGFNEVKTGSFDEHESLGLYDYQSALKSIRLQNGTIDTHGLIRLWIWDKPRNKGIGFAPPRTIGQRIAVMKTHDIFRLQDIFNNARDHGAIWHVTDPVADDLFNLNQGKTDFFNKPIIVRENAVYGQFMNHIFFQRYGYHIEGYGTIHPDTPLQTSEFTHHDFFISATDMEQMSYLSTALGLQAEEDPKLDGEWLKGPRQVFDLKAGESHWYQGFVSPNNICGKLKFFIPTSLTSDQSDAQLIGSLGNTMHSFHTAKLNYVHQLVTAHQLSPSPILKNEFDELSFTFKGPGACSWQIIGKENFSNKAVQTLEIGYTKN